MSKTTQKINRAAKRLYNAILLLLSCAGIILVIEVIVTHMGIW